MHFRKKIEKAISLTLKANFSSIPSVFHFTVILVVFLLSVLHILATVFIRSNILLHLKMFLSDSLIDPHAKVC